MKAKYWLIESYHEYFVSFIYLSILSIYFISFTYSLLHNLISYYDLSVVTQGCYVTYIHPRSRCHKAYTFKNIIQAHHHIYTYSYRPTYVTFMSFIVSCVYVLPVYYVQAMYKSSQERKMMHLIPYSYN